MAAAFRVEAVDPGQRKKIYMVQKFQILDILVCGEMRCLAAIVVLQVCVQWTPHRSQQGVGMDEASVYILYAILEIGSSIKFLFFQKKEDILKW